MRSIVLLMTLAASLSAGAQSRKGLIFTEETYNFGTVKAWDNPPAVFTFENTTFDPMYILAPKSGRNIYVEYPKNKIESGEKGQVKIYFYTEVLGAFSEEILLYASTSTEPVRLTVKGNIKSLAENALTQCPDFSGKGKPELTEFMTEGLVIDKLTRQPVADAIVNWPGKEAIYTNQRGEFREKIYAGFYVTLAQAPGYRDLNLSVSVKNGMERVVYELIPLSMQPVERDTTPEPVAVVKEDSIPLLPDEQSEFRYREYKANNIVFLVDVSSSMKQKGKIDSLKTAMVQMASILRSVDNVTLITFATATNEVLTDVQGNNKELVISSINGLVAKGTTDGVLGLEKAFQSALNNYIEEGNNQVIVATDGMFNGAGASEGQIYGLIQSYREKGITLSVIGFGKDRAALPTMQKMSETGGGNFIHFAENTDVRRLLVEEIKRNSRRK